MLVHPVGSEMELEMFAAGICGAVARGHAGRTGRSRGVFASYGLRNLDADGSPPSTARKGRTVDDPTPRVLAVPVPAGDYLSPDRRRAACCAVALRDATVAEPGMQ